MQGNLETLNTEVMRKTLINILEKRWPFLKLLVVIKERVINGIHYAVFHFESTNHIPRNGDFNAEDARYYIVKCMHLGYDHLDVDGNVDGDPIPYQIRDIFNVPLQRGDSVFIRLLDFLMLLIMRRRC